MVMNSNEKICQLIKDVLYNILHIFYSCTSPNLNPNFNSNSNSNHIHIDHRKLGNIMACTYFFNGLHNGKGIVITINSNTKGQV